MTTMKPTTAEAPATTIALAPLNLTAAASTAVVAAPMPQLLIRETCVAGLLPGRGKWKTQYHPALANTLMTKESFQERIEYLNSTVALCKTFTLAWLQVPICTIAGFIFMMLRIGSPAFETCGYDNACTARFNDGNTAAAITFGICVPLMILSMVISAPRRGFKPTLLRAVERLNQVDAPAGLVWDVESKTTYVFLLQLLCIPIPIWSTCYLKLIKLPTAEKIATDVSLARNKQQEDQSS